MPRLGHESTGDCIVDALQRLQTVADHCNPQHRRRVVQGGVAMTAVQEMIGGRYHVRASVAFEKLVDSDLGIIAWRRDGLCFIGQLARVSYFKCAEAECRAVTLGFDEPEVLSLEENPVGCDGAQLQVPVSNIEQCLRLDLASPRRPWRQ